MGLVSCNWDKAQYLIFSGNVYDPLIYYSHILPLVLSLVIGFIAYFKNRQSLVNKLLLILTIIFSLWVFFDLILWASEKIEYIMFFWSIIVFLDLMIYVVSYYLTRVFIQKRDISLKKKVILTTLFIPIILFAHSAFNLESFNYTNCNREAVEGLLIKYSYFAEVLILFWIIIVSYKGYLATENTKKDQIKFFSLGIVIFLLTFSLGNFAMYFKMDWALEQYKLFGMPVFVAFLTYIIVKYEAFNVKIHGAQAIIVGLFIVVGSQLFYLDDTSDRVLTAITLSLTVLFGLFLLRSIRNEDRKKTKELEIVNQQLISHQSRLQKANEKLINDKRLIEAANEELLKLDSVKSEFVNITSHQLRAPVTIIKGVASMLNSGKIEKLAVSDQKEFYNSLWTKSTKLETIIKDILNVASLTNRKYAIKDQETEIIDIKQLLKKIVADFQPEVMQKKIKLAFNHPKEEILIRGQKEDLEEAFNNLINNAIKYPPSQKGQIVITLRTEDNKVVVEIKDNGIGISQEDLPKLFDKFFRAENAKSQNVDGSGLGLFVVKEIIEGHGGSVFVASKLNKGSNFILNFKMASINK